MDTCYECEEIRLISPVEDMHKSIVIYCAERGWRIISLSLQEKMGTQCIYLTKALPDTFPMQIPESIIQTALTGRKQHSLRRSEMVKTKVIPVGKIAKDNFNLGMGEEDD